MVKKKKFFDVESKVCINLYLGKLETLNIKLKLWMNILPPVMQLPHLGLHTGCIGTRRGGTNVSRSQIQTMLKALCHFVIEDFIIFYLIALKLKSNYPENIKTEDERLINLDSQFTKMLLFPHVLIGSMSQIRQLFGHACREEKDNLLLCLLEREDLFIDNGLNLVCFDAGIHLLKLQS